MHKTIFTWFGNLPTSMELQGFHYKIRRYNSAQEHSQETQFPIHPNSLSPTRQWYKKFDSFMHRIGFKRCEASHCCYVKSFDNSYIILLLYVDDMLLAGSSIEEINNLKKQLSKQFAMKDLGAAKQILG